MSEPSVYLSTSEAAPEPVSEAASEVASEAVSEAASEAVSEATSEAAVPAAAESGPQRVPPAATLLATVYCEWDSNKMSEECVDLLAHFEDAVSGVAWALKTRIGRSSEGNPLLLLMRGVRAALPERLCVEVKVTTFRPFKESVTTTKLFNADGHLLVLDNIIDVTLQVRVSTFYSREPCGNCCDWALFRHCTDLADVVLVVADADVPVHKQVLCARSPVFRSMFTLDFKEKREMRVVVEGAGATPQALHKFLEFLYSSQVKDFEGLELDVMLLADRYQVEALRVLCQDMFELNTDNVLEALVLSDAVNAVLLKRKALSLAVKNLAAVMASPGWQDFHSQHNDLVDDILKEGMTQKSMVSNV